MSLLKQTFDCDWIIIDFTSDAACIIAKIGLFAFLKYCSNIFFYV